MYNIKSKTESWFGNKKKNVYEMLILGKTYTFFRLKYYKARLKRTVENCETIIYV